MSAAIQMRAPEGQRSLRDAYAQFPSGVVAVCAERDGVLVGLAVSAFVPVSLDPPIVSVCLRAESGTWPKLRSASRLGISVLGADHHAAARALAGPEAERFRDIALERRGTGAVTVDGALLAMEVTLTDEIPVGDHSVAICRVEEMKVDRTRPPLLFHRSTFCALHDESRSTSD